MQSIEVIAALLQDHASYITLHRTAKILFPRFISSHYSGGNEVRSFTIRRTGFLHEVTWVYDKQITITIKQ